MTRVCIDVPESSRSTDTRSVPAQLTAVKCVCGHCNNIFLGVKSEIFTIQGEDVMVDMRIFLPPEAWLEAFALLTPLLGQKQ